MSDDSRAIPDEWNATPPTDEMEPGFVWHVAIYRNHRHSGLATFIGPDGAERAAAFHAFMNEDR